MAENIVPKIDLSLFREGNKEQRKEQKKRERLNYKYCNHFAFFLKKLFSLTDQELDVNREYTITIINRINCIGILNPFL